MNSTKQGRAYKLQKLPALCMLWTLCFVLRCLKLHNSGDLCKTNSPARKRPVTYRYAGLWREPLTQQLLLFGRNHPSQ